MDSSCPNSAELVKEFEILSIKPQETKESEDIKKVVNIAKPVGTMPDYSNAATKATLEKLGHFNYDVDTITIKELEGITLIRREPYELDNGSVYLG